MVAGRELRAERLVHAPAEAVWSALTDLAAAPDILRGVSRVEVLEGPDYEVGTRWRETRRIFGKEESQTMEVASCDRPRGTTVVSRSAGLEYRKVYGLEPTEAGTLLTVCFGASHPDPTLLRRLTATLFGHVGAAVTTRLLHQDLADVAARAESEG